MDIALITPAAARVKNGNRNTAQRWASFLRESGHRVRVQVVWDGRPADMMVALHARRSHDSIKRFAASQPRSPLIVVLTGTDLYRDIRCIPEAQESMELATRMVVLQEMGLEELKPGPRDKTRVIYQSAPSVNPRTHLKSRFEVSVIGNLREEKDPFRTAVAAALLPLESRIRVVHVGAALSGEMAAQAQELMRANPRYHWLGELPHWRTRARLARSHLMTISSRMEGGANVICEALAAGVPVLASAVPGNVGMLGKDYAGYFPCCDERALAQVLRRAEAEPDFYQLLRDQCAARRPLFEPEQEKAGLNALLDELRGL
jgi:putative glycosyltransferase (TIGR04348 family)